MKKGNQNPLPTQSGEILQERSPSSMLDALTTLWGANRRLQTTPRMRAASFLHWCEEFAFLQPLSGWHLAPRIGYRQSLPLKVAHRPVDAGILLLHSFRNRLSSFFLSFFFVICIFFPFPVFFPFPFSLICFSRELITFSQECPFRKSTPEWFSLRKWVLVV